MVLIKIGYWWLVGYRWVYILYIGTWIYWWLWGSELIKNFAQIILFMLAGHYLFWISWFTWKTWLIIHDIPDNYNVHVTIIAGKILYTVTTPSCYTCYMSCYTGILFTDIIYPVILVSWLHMLTLLPWLLPCFPSDLGNLYFK